MFMYYYDYGRPLALLRVGPPLRPPATASHGNAQQEYYLTQALDKHLIGISYSWGAPPEVA